MESKANISLFLELEKPPKGYDSIFVESKGILPYHYEYYLFSDSK
jgi:hypothetical protein